jgi:hypothetical protein
MREFGCGACEPRYRRPVVQSWPKLPTTVRGQNFNCSTEAAGRHTTDGLTFLVGLGNDEARTRFQFGHYGHYGNRGSGLALVHARLCRLDFQALTVRPEPVPPQTKSTIFRREH